MPDMLKTRDAFMSMVGGAGALNFLAAVEQPLDVYGPCWCASGKKWKFCHKDREKREPLPFGKVNAERLKYYATGPCQHPDASATTCSSPASIKSHTIQRRGGLGAIAESGHVCSTKKAFMDLEKRGGQVDMENIGVGQASTFPGFCSHHDTELFKPVEQANSKLDAYNSFLLSLRAVTYEMATKDSQLRSHVASKEYIDYGRSFEQQAMLQNFLSLHQIGIEQGLKDVTQLKVLYDGAFQSQDFSKFSFYGVEFDRVLPFAAAGAFMPEFDFSGTQLQEIEVGQPVSQIALNVTQLGNNTCVVFGWFGGSDCAAARLVDSFKAVSDHEKADALLVLAMEHLENFFCTPSWWAGLASEVSAKLHEKIAGGVPDRSPTALVEPGLNAVVAGVAGTLEYQETKQ
ncbi:hypothetical protein [Burkholderia vietnamiensis]|uniref:hypothetical protein n=1 Tax=Burkholderia vietnamiensis TaxID=60552 RepID=UPI000758999E|nr:hypothetical protein [Burkholderia vietnamiensis]KVF66456.1 hypothetical protein WJ17_00285 [Burkholderia vietnamiensis]GBH27888.1 SecC motif-containing protein [Burkholderia vietnamiensis]